MTSIAERCGGTRELQPIGERARAWFYWLAWIGVIQFAASGSFAASETSRWIGPLLAWLFPAADADSLAAAHFVIRKAAHVAEYAILALLGLRALQTSFERSFAWLAVASLLFALAVAAIDESRQAASAQRTGAVSDVALDLAGAASALAIAAAVRRHNAVRRHKDGRT